MKSERFGPQQGTAAAKKAAMVVNDPIYSSTATSKTATIGKSSLRKVTSDWFADDGQ